MQKKITRQSQHSLKFSTTGKRESLERLFTDYKDQLQFYIDLIWTEQLPLKTFLSSKDLPEHLFSFASWKQICYQNASQIVRSNLKKNRERRFKKYKKLYRKCKENRKYHERFLNKKFSELNLKKFTWTKPVVKSISINVDTKGYKDILNVNGEFDQFIRLILPWKEKINLPIKQTKQSLKFKEWKRCNTFRLNRINENFYLNFAYQKETPDIKSEGEHLGIDIGVNKLIADSNGNFYGMDFKKIVEKLNKKKFKSRNWNQTLTELKNYVGQTVNKIDFNSLNLLVKEDLKNISRNTKKNKKLNKTSRRLLSNWNRKLLEEKLEQRCAENGVFLTSIDPAFTSQRCSSCGEIHKNSRNGEDFNCPDCGMNMDSDHNGARNVLQDFIEKHEACIVPRGNKVQLQGVERLYKYF